MKRLLAAVLSAVVFGFTAPAQAATALPTGGAESTAGTITFLPVLLDQAAVRHDLGLSRVQEGRIDIIRAECRAKVGVLSAAGLMDASLAPAAVKDLPAYQERCNARILSLLTPTQRVRLREIERRFQGGLFLLVPGEQDLLGLTAAQRVKISEIHSIDFAKAATVVTAFREGKKTPLRRDLDLHRLHRTTARSMLHVLTGAQKKQWLSSLGTPLRVS